ncbi:MAG: LysM peptidoglycan-binding domain-containing protein [Oligoflexales bacterium]
MKIQFDLRLKISIGIGATLLGAFCAFGQNNYSLDEGGDSFDEGNEGKEEPVEDYLNQSLEDDFANDLIQDIEGEGGQQGNAGTAPYNDSGTQSAPVATPNNAAATTPTNNYAAPSNAASGGDGSGIDVNNPVSATPSPDGSEVPIDAPLDPTSETSPTDVVTEPAEPESDPVDGAPPIVRGVKPQNKFGGAPSLPGSMRTLAYGEAPQEYTVEGGDTLFDICDQFLDEAGYWPKLWSYNPEVKNPHFIFPGTTLRFYPGDESTPPSLLLVTEDDIVPLDKEGIKEAELVAEDYSKLLLDFGESSPTPLVDDSTLVPPEGLFIDYPEPRAPKDIKVTLPAFVYKDPQESLGVVVAGTEGRTLMSDNEEFLVKANQLSPHERYTVVRGATKVVTADGRFVGVRYEFVAQMEVEESLGDGHFVANVTQTRLGVQPDDQIIAYKSTTRSIPAYLGSPTSSSGSSVVGFDYPEQVIGGRGSFVLLENGAAVLSKGSTIRIFKNVAGEDYPALKRNVAIVHVVDDGGPAVLGYVVQNKLQVEIGDKTGG